MARSSGTASSFQGSASAAWSDSFTIVAVPGTGGTEGHIGGAARVTGSLGVDFTARAYADSYASASVDLFPDTGYSGGRTIALGNARRYGGYDIA